MKDSSENPLFSFGLFADCQYADIPSTKHRFFSVSKEKLSTVINAFNQENLEFVVNFGDLINENLENFSSVLMEIKNSRHKIYNILGNHDFNVNDDHKSIVPPMLGLEKPYYSFSIQNWRFIIIDGTELSPEALPKDSEAYKTALKYKKDHRIHSPNWNGAISQIQLLWLKDQLQLAENIHENVLIFSHYPIFPKNIHNLWNAHEIKALIRHFTCVKGFIAGHNHGGNFGLLRKSFFSNANRIPCITLMGMVDTPENVYYICRIFSDRFLLEGYGRETFHRYSSTEGFTFTKILKN